MIRVIITGCRSWNCDALAARVVAGLLAKHGPDLVVVHGAAPGVDTAFARAAEAAGVRVEAWPADWATGKSPG